MDLQFLLPAFAGGTAKPPIVAALFRYEQEKLEKNWSRSFIATARRVNWPMADYPGSRPEAVR
jgi:hypothetical protein